MPVVLPLKSVHTEQLITSSIYNKHAQPCPAVRNHSCTQLLANSFCHPLHKRDICWTRRYRLFCVHRIYLATFLKTLGTSCALLKTCDLEPKNIDRTQEIASFLNVKDTAWTVKLWNAPQKYFPTFSNIFQVNLMRGSQKYARILIVTMNFGEQTKTVDFLSCPILW